MAATIRIARCEEAEAIASTLMQAFRPYQPAYSEEGYAATTPMAEQIRHRFTEGPIWVAAVGDEIVGTVAAVLKMPGVYVRSLAVLPSSRGRGIGELLLSSVEDFARAERASYLFLSATPFLKPAIHLYEKCGFRRTSEGPHDLFGTPLLTMRKELLHPGPGHPYRE
jgi:ribosomal protein S18 acetylase RimI-like enzyme